MRLHKYIRNGNYNFIGSRYAGVPPICKETFIRLESPAAGLKLIYAYVSLWPSCSSCSHTRRFTLAIKHLIASFDMHVAQGMPEV